MQGFCLKKFFQALLVLIWPFFASRPIILPAKEAAQMDDATIEIRHLHKTFPLTRKQRKEKHTEATRLTAVNDISLTLRSGEIYGLLGPNGAGKTTTLRMLSSLIDPDSGEVLFHGQHIKDNIGEYRKRVSFLTSELKLDDFFTPDYTFHYMGELFGVSKDEILSRKKALFDKFGINDFANVQIKNLSTGMKQKASLAIALCHDPEVIIFDEPTNGLDIIASRDVENFLIDLRKEGKTIIVSTHIFSLVEKLCDRVGIIANGSLVLEGEMREVTKEKSLENVFFDLLEEGRI